MDHCKICRYFYPRYGVNNEIEKESYCHRFPKKVKVKANHWCGEFDEQMYRTHE